jgi:hypothetical protein
LERSDDMLNSPGRVMLLLLQLGYPPEDVIQAVIDVFGISRKDAALATREMARRCQEEDIEFAHTIIEHEAAVAAEWRE